MKRMISPASFAGMAALIALLYAAAHLAGWREDTTILSGTAPPGGAAGLVEGLAYVVLHFAALVGAPILLLAAALFWGLERAMRRRYATR